VATVRVVKSIENAYNLEISVSREYARREDVTGRHVMSESSWGGLSVTDTHPTWRKNRDKNRRLLIADKNPGSYNKNMFGAHAELGNMQEAYDLAVKNGRLAELQKQTFSMTVVGRHMCVDCLKDIPLMAKEMGLSSLVVFEKESGNIFYWVKGQKKLRSLF